MPSPDLPWGAGSHCNPVATSGTLLICHNVRDCAQLRFTPPCSVAVPAVAVPPPLVVRTLPSANTRVCPVRPPCTVREFPTFLQVGALAATLALSGGYGWGHQQGINGCVLVLSNTQGKGGCLQGLPVPQVARVPGGSTAGVQLLILFNPAPCSGGGRCAGATEPSGAVSFPMACECDPHEASKPPVPPQNLP